MFQAVFKIACVVGFCLIGVSQAQLVIRNSVQTPLLIFDLQKRVGIGAEMPSATLDIQGSLAIRSGAGSGTVLHSDEQGVAHWRAIAGDLTGTPDHIQVGGLQGRALSAAAPAEGDVVKWQADPGIWRPAPDVIGQTGEGDITSITVSNGLIGGGTSGDVTIAARVEDAIWNGGVLQGGSISATAPTNNGLLMYRNSNWTSADSTTSPVWNAARLVNYPISTQAPQSHQLLMFNQGQWRPGFTADDSVWNAKRLQGLQVRNIQPVIGEFLNYASDYNMWVPSPYDSTDAVYNGNRLQGKAVGNLTAIDALVMSWDESKQKWVSLFRADSAMWNANRLIGNPLANVQPKAGQLLTFRSGQWTPGDSTNEAIWNGKKLGSTPISSFAPSDGEFLAYAADYANWQPSIANAGTASWNAKKILGYEVSTLTPLDKQILTWDENLAQWRPWFSEDSSIYNANKIMDNAIAADQPLNGQILTWFNSAWRPGHTPDDTVYNAQYLQSIAIGSAAPSVNQILKYSSAFNQWRPANDNVGTLAQMQQQSLLQQQRAILRKATTVLSESSSSEEILVLEKNVARLEAAAP